MKAKIDTIIKKFFLAFASMLFLYGCSSTLGDFPPNFKTPYKLIIKTHNQQDQYTITDTTAISKIMTLMQNSYEVSPRNCKCMINFEMHFLNENNEQLRFYFLAEHSPKFYDFIHKNTFRISKSELKNIIQSNDFDISNL